MTIGRIPSVEGGIQPTIVDAKGDLIAAVAADSVNRLAVGSNDQVLVADSSASTGLAWKSYGSQLNASNPVINGAMDIWQRGTSIAISATTSGYTADRWMLFAPTNAASTISRQVTGDTTNLPNIQYCARVQRNSGQTGTNNIEFIQSFETSNSIPYAGKTVTLSFYARKGANFSGSLDFLLVTGTGTDQNFLTAYTGSLNAIEIYNVGISTTWQRFTATATLASNISEMTVRFRWSPSGTAGAADYYEITGVQIDVGSVATPFRRNGGTIQGELAACQRYYEICRGNVISPTSTGGLANTYTAAFSYKVTKRAIPTLTIFSGADQAGTSGSATWYASNVATVAAAAQEMNQADYFSLRRAGSTDATLVAYSFTASAEL